MAQPMLEVLAPTHRLIADKAYDADRLRGWLNERRIEAVIPGRASRDVAYPLNRTAYRRRNIIERMFGKLKTGSVSQLDTTASPSTTSQPSLSLLWQLNGSNEPPT